MGQFRPPMLATAWPAPFDDAAWSFEVKWDGYRAILANDGGTPELFSRRGNRISDRFSALLGVAPPGVVLDGEVVAFGADGRPSFQGLQGSSDGVHLIVFDVLVNEGRDVTAQPLDERRRILESIELGRGGVLSDRVIGDGMALWEAIVERDLEGMVAKRRASAYEPGGRSKAWRKIVHRHALRAVVGGWLPGDDGSSVRSLLLGLRDGDRWRYVGSVGSGFSGAALAALAAAFGEMETPDSPFDRAVPATARFVTPHLVVRVHYRNWTDAGVLRHPVFVGVDEADPDQVTVDDELS